MLVTASAVTARRLANAIGMTATATAKRSGLSARASDMIPATAAANRIIQASLTITMVRPYAFVHISLQRIGFCQMFLEGRYVVEPPVPRAWAARRASRAMFQLLTCRMATRFVPTIMSPQRPRNETRFPPAGESAANIARAGEICSPTRGPNHVATASPVTIQATNINAVIATA